MEFARNFLVTFLLVVDFTLITPQNQNPVINTDCIVIENRIPENNTHPLFHLLQPEVQLKDGNLASVVERNTLGNALKSCYFSSSAVALILFVGFEDDLMDVIKKISEDVQQHRKTKRQSNCKIFLFGQTQISNSNETLFIDLLSTSLPTPFPFDISSDFYVVFNVNDAITSIQQPKIWEIYSAKQRIFVQPLESEYSLNDEINIMHHLLFHIKPTKTIRRQNLQGIQLVVAAYLNREDENDDMYEVMVGKNENGEDMYVSGLSVSIWDDIRTATNFTDKTLKLYFEGDNYFETTFTSEQVYFDINLFHLGVTRNRTKVAQPLHPTFYDGVHAIFSQPSDKKNIYGKPFTLEMWLTLLSAWILIFLSFQLFLHLQSRKMFQSTSATIKIKYLKVESGKPNKPTIHEELTVCPYAPFETSLWCVGTICQQGWYKLPKPTPIRLILITGLFLSVTCYAAFTGKLVSDLYDVSKPIKSLKSLMEYTDRIYLIAGSDTSYDVLEGLSSSDPHLIQKVRFSSGDKILSKLLEVPGRACVITWTDNVDTKVRERFRKTRSGKESILNSQADAFSCAKLCSFSFQGTSSLYVPKDSELEQLFNYR
ncbi:unnamed protein product [Orchesella dallaii]|uniref:Ionotropic receptor n=1 Tax=Orchesella dallaii TaxID=48710 RepID=A0ABP1R9M3_9HEXA